MYLFNNKFRYTYNYPSTYFGTYITLHYITMYRNMSVNINILQNTCISDAHFSVHCTTQTAICLYSRTTTCFGHNIPSSAYQYRVL